MIITAKKQKHGTYITPLIAYSNERYYYGYKVSSLWLAWLKWTVHFQFGVKSYEELYKNKERV